MRSDVVVVDLHPDNKLLITKSAVKVPYNLSVFTGGMGASIPPAIKLTVITETVYPLKDSHNANQ
jgi:hypothetical protein